MEIKQSVMVGPMNMSKFPKTQFFFSVAALWSGLWEGGRRMIEGTFPSCLFWVGVTQRVSTGDAATVCSVSSGNNHY